MRLDLREGQSRILKTHNAVSFCKDSIEYTETHRFRSLIQTQLKTLLASQKGR